MPLTAEERKALMEIAPKSKKNVLTDEEREALLSLRMAPPEGTLPVYPPSSDPPYPYDPEAIGGSFNPMNRLRRLANVPHDLGQVGMNTAQVVAEPIKSGKAFGGMVAGAGQTVGQRIAKKILGKDYEKFLNESMPHLTEKKPGSEVGLPPESGMYLDDMKRRYIDNPGETTTNEPIQSLMDALSVIQPGARLAGGTKGALAAQKLNPLKQGGDIAGKILGKVTDRSKIKGTGDVLSQLPGGREEFIGTATGRSPIEARELRRMGQRNNPEELKNFKEAQGRKTKLEPIVQSFAEALKSKQREISTVFGETLPKYKNIIGEDGQGKLAKGLNDVKEKLIDRLRQFNINVKGRAKLTEGIEESRLLQTESREIDIPRMAPGQTGGTPLSSVTQERPPTVAGKDMSGWLKKAFKPTGRNVPAVTDAQLANFEDVVNKVLKHESPLPEDLHALKEYVSDFIDEQKVKSPGTKLDAFAAPIVKEIDDLLRETLTGNDNIPSYSKMADDYDTFIKHREEVATAFSLDANPGTQIKKLLDVYSDNPSNEFARRVFESIVDQSDDKIRASILGTNWERRIGQGLIAKQQAAGAVRELLGATVGGGAIGAFAGGGAGAIVGGLVGALGGFVDLAVTSPRLMSSYLVRLGKKSSPEYRSKLNEIGQVANRVYNEAKKRGIPIEGLTYGEVLQRLEIPDRTEEEQKNKVSKRVLGTGKQQPEY